VLETISHDRPTKNAKSYTCYWYKDLVRGKHDHWYISFAMQHKQGKPKNVVYPIGALPNFRLGREYNGRQDVTAALNGRLDVACFVDLAQGELVKAWPWAKPFLHFYKDKDIGKQWLWKIESGRISYFIPCVELLRALFIPNSTFARALFRPAGLAEICPPPKISESNLHFDFFPNVPISSVNSAVSLRLLSWLHIDDAARESWHSIYKYHASARHRDKPSIPVRFTPPSIKDVTIDFRGVENKYDPSEFLVFEIERILFPPLGLSHISYSHPKMQRRKEGDRPSGGTRTIVSKRAKQKLQESNVDAKATSNVAVVKTPMMLIESAETLHIQPILNGAIHIGSTGAGDKALPPSTIVRKSVSANDVSKEGTAAPLEFKSVGRNDLRKDDGLYVFSAAIKSLANANPTWKVTQELFELQGDSAFCFTFNRRRRCLLITFVFVDRASVWLIEIERTGGVTRSTLAIKEKSRESLEYIESVVQAFAENLQTAAGRWLDTRDSWIENHFFISRINHAFDYESMTPVEKINELHRRLTAAVLFV